MGGGPRGGGGGGTDDRGGDPKTNRTLEPFNFLSTSVSSDDSTFFSDKTAATAVIAVGAKRTAEEQLPLPLIAGGNGDGGGGCEEEESRGENLKKKKKKKKYASQIPGPVLGSLNVVDDASDLLADGYCLSPPQVEVDEGRRGEGEIVAVAGKEEKVEGMSSEGVDDGTGARERDR